MSCYTCSQVLDTRVPSAGCAVTHGVLTLPWAPKGLSTAAVRGSIVAAGAREAVRAWDLRSVSTGAAAAGSSSGTGLSSSSRLLLSGSMPGKGHVSHLQLDAGQLVAASSRTRLHLAAGIAVWDLDSGSRLELPSSWWVSGVRCDILEWASACRGEGRYARLQPIGWAAACSLMLPSGPLVLQQPNRCSVLPTGLQRCLQHAHAIQFVLLCPCPCPDPSAILPLCCLTACPVSPFTAAFRTAKQSQQPWAHHMVP